MKKYIILSLLMATVVYAGIGCIKDKGFEDHEYGINDPDTSPLGVGFAETTSSTTKAINSIATAQTISDPVINLLSGEPAKSDIHIKLVSNPTLVADYNAANPTSAPLTAMPAGQYNIPSMDIVIPAGQRTASIKINVPNATLVDATKAYGFGFTIASVDAGYTIASNLKNLMVKVVVKNKYDGNYETKGAAFHPAYGNYKWNSVGVYSCGNGFSLVTSGPNSVILDPGQPLINGGSLTYFSAVLPQFTVDPATGKVSIATTNSTVFDNFPTYNSRYDEATKTFYVKFGWSGDRVATDTFTYCGPR